MRERTFVIGVGMTKFDKPGAKEGDYPDWVREAGTNALEDAGVGYEAVEQAYAGYVLRRLDLRAARPLRARHHRHPRRQRQQQLLDRIERAVPRPAGDRRRRSSTAPWPSASRGWRKARSGSSTRTARRPSTTTSRTMVAGRAGLGGRARRPADVRQRRPRAHGDVTARRPSTSRGSPGRTTVTPRATRTRSSRPSTRARRSTATREDLRAAHEAPVLTDLGRSGMRRSSPPSASSTSTSCGHALSRSPGRRWPRTSPPPSRGTAAIMVCGFDLSRVAAARALGEAVAGHRRGRRDRAARLLLDQRAADLRGTRARRRGRGSPARRGRGDDVRWRRACSEPERRADLEGASARRDRARPVRGADLAAARRRPSSCRSAEPASRTSTPSGPVAPPS